MSFFGKFKSLEDKIENMTLLPHLKIRTKREMKRKGMQWASMAFF